MATVASGDDCKPVTAETVHSVTSYISKRLKLSDTSLISVIKQERVEGSCYTKFTLAGESLAQPLVLFLSPDFRYLSTSLLDTTIDPEREMRQEVERNRVVLSLENSPSRGNQNAAVTVVQFSDFECPYCKQFAEWMSALPEDLRSQVRIVYKNFPLPIHPWAHEAAVLASCADLQSVDAFWRLHDFMFKNQKDLSPSTLHNRVQNFAQTIPGFSIKDLFACSARGQAEAAIYHDKLLVDELQIDSTPTIFLNGLRIESLGSLADLVEKLRQAFRTSAAQRPTTSQDRK